MTTLVEVHPGWVCAPRFAASLERCEAEGMPFSGVTSMFRSDEQQLELFLARYVTHMVTFPGGGFDRRYMDGVAYYRKAETLLPVAPPGTSEHGKGLAIDARVGSPIWQWLMAFGPGHGIVHTLPRTDPVHFEYQDWLDEAFDPVALEPLQTMEDDMILIHTAELGNHATWSGGRLRTVPGPMVAAVIRAIGQAVEVSKDEFLGFVALSDTPIVHCDNADGVGSGAHALVAPGLFNTIAGPAVADAIAQFGYPREVSKATWDHLRGVVEVRLPRHAS